jgi:G6PDH family F420-dependent oxidoreductase
MVEFGYALSSEEHEPTELVRLARKAEESGFTFALISDHYHPWIDRQGHSSFVWSVLGGIAMETETLRLGTGVTCPLIRTHPAIIAQAAATVAAMMPGRFFLGVGTGEALNEHIAAEYWPPIDQRRDMLAESMQIMRELWEGASVDHHGAYYDVVDARVYTLPETPPEIFVAAGGEKTAELAGELGDGLITTTPKKDLLKAFDAAGGSGKKKLGQVTVCYGANAEQAKQTAYEIWPTAGLKGELTQELPLPRHFEQAVENITADEIGEIIVCGPDLEAHVKALREYVDAGFDGVYVHQIGPEQDAFFAFYSREVLPALKRETSRAA